MSCPLQLLKSVYRNCSHPYSGAARAQAQLEAEKEGCICSDYERLSGASLGMHLRPLVAV